MENSLFTQHATLSLMVWLTSLAFGCGFGAISIWPVRPLLRRYPRLYGLLVILPWRTVVLNLMFLCLIFPAQESAIMTMLNLTGSPFVATLAHLGRGKGMLAASLFMALLAWSLTVSMLVARWHPTAIIVRVVSLARTLATSSVLIALFVELLAKEGLGASLIRYLGFVDILNTTSLWFQIIIGVLMVDIGLGLVQILVLYFNRLLTRLPQRLKAT